MPCATGCGRSPTSGRNRNFGDSSIALDRAATAASGSRRVPAPCASSAISRLLLGGGQRTPVGALARSRRDTAPRTPPRRCCAAASQPVSVVGSAVTVCAIGLRRRLVLLHADQAARLRAGQIHEAEHLRVGHEAQRRAACSRGTGRPPTATYSAFVSRRIGTDCGGGPDRRRRRARRCRRRPGGRAATSPTPIDRFVRTLRMTLRLNHLRYITLERVYEPLRRMPHHNRPALPTPSRLRA